MQGMMPGASFALALLAYLSTPVDHNPNPSFPPSLRLSPVGVMGQGPFPSPTMSPEPRVGMSMPPPMGSPMTYYGHPDNMVPMQVCRDECRHGLSRP